MANMLTRKSRRSVTEIILDILQKEAEIAVDLFGTMLSSYPESYRRARRGMLGEPAREFKKSWSELYRDKKNFYSLLQKLKRDGLIENDSVVRGRPALWRITSLGKKKYFNLKKRTEWGKWFRQQQKSPKIIIVSYDIPETYRRERAWVRDILKLFKFTMIHRSVWVGTTALPREFIDELREKKLLDYIEIFEVSKRGTISKIGGDDNR